MDGYGLVHEVRNKDWKEFWKQTPGTYLENHRNQQFHGIPFHLGVKGDVWGMRNRGMLGFP